MPKKLTQEQFVEKAKTFHGEEYCYKSSVYLSMHKKIDIECKKHGKFKQTPNSHIRGQGCPDCGYKKCSKKSTGELFISKATALHGNTYDYSKVNYSLSNKKVIIICRHHGEFKQTPNGHLLNRGCRACVDENRENYWTYSNWKKAGEKSKRFDSFKVYIIRCWNDDEEFYKIGKTFMSVYDRFYYQKIPYKYEVVKVIKGQAKEISKTEKELQKNNINIKYIPKIKFSGSNECFSNKPII